MSEGNLFIAIIINVLSLVLYILWSWGLYLINKKLGEEYAWLSFIPIVQIYSLMKASGKPIIWLLRILLLYITYFISIFLIVFAGPIIGGILMFIIIIILLIITIKIFHGISTRCGKGGWTTLGFLLISFIMFPYVGYNMPDKTLKNPQNLNSSETINL